MGCARCMKGSKRGLDFRLNRIIFPARDVRRPNAAIFWMDNAWDGNANGIHSKSVLIRQMLKPVDFRGDQAAHGFALSALERHHAFIERLAPFGEKPRGEFGAAEINSNHSV